MASSSSAPAQQLPGVGGVPAAGSLQRAPHPHPARDPLPSSRQAGRLSWLTLHPAYKCHRPPLPPAPGVHAGHWAKCQTTKRERPGCLGSGCRCGCPAAAGSRPARPRTDGWTDGQTAALAATTPGHGQASHSFVFLLWLWLLFSSSPPFSLSLGAFQYRRCRRVAACSGELLCLQVSSAR